MIAKTLKEAKDLKRQFKAQGKEAVYTRINKNAWLLQAKDGSPL